MPYKNKEDRQAHDRKYYAEHEDRRQKQSQNATLYRKKMTHQWAEWLNAQKCSLCGSTNELCFHHIDASTKLFNMMSHPHISQAKMQEEAKKCIILCKSCHMRLHDNLHNANWHEYH